MPAQCSASESTSFIPWAKAANSTCKEHGRSFVVHLVHSRGTMKNNFFGNKTEFHYVGIQHKNPSLPGRAKCLRAATERPQSKQFDARAKSLSTPTTKTPLMHRHVHQATTPSSELHCRLQMLLQSNVLTMIVKRLQRLTNVLSKHRNVERRNHWHRCVRIYIEGHFS